MKTGKLLKYTGLLLLYSVSLTFNKPSLAQTFGNSFEGGRGLFYMQSARTLGKGHFLLGIQSLGMQREYPVSYQDDYVKNYTNIIGLPVSLGLTEEVDITLSAYGFSNARPYINQADVFQLYGSPKNGLGIVRAGLKVRLPLDISNKFQIAGKLGALLGTSGEQIDGLNYRWTRDGTDIEASLLETIDVFSWASLYLEQGYILSGSAYYDDQYAGGLGVEIRPHRKLSLSIEANNHTFDTISPYSAVKSIGNPSYYYGTQAGNPKFLKDNELDYWDDFFVIVPSIVYKFNENVSVNIGAVINVADQEDPKETAQIFAGINFMGIFEFMLDSDNDGVKDNRDLEPGTPKGYPVDMRGVSLDTDKDGVPDGRDREPGTIMGAVIDKWGKALDSDKDGVPDGIDRQPDTPAYVKIDRFGVALDSDEDGVPDSLDKDPYTPRGAKVDSFGVALDSDKDGVPDYKDLEPNTAKGARVDSNGRTIRTEIKREVIPEVKPEIKPEEKSFLQEGVLRTDRIHFESGSSKLTFDSYAVLRTAAGIFAKYPSLRIQIEGHTDNAGKRELNMRLSLARAKAVLDYLLDEDSRLNPDRFTVKGYGPDRPVASNNTVKGKQLNRRVDFVVLNKEELQKISPK